MTLTPPAPKDQPPATASLELPFPGPLVTPAWLQAHLHHPQLRLMDCRWYLQAPERAREAYLEGHLPGAQWVDVEHELARHPGPGRHPLPDMAAFQAVMRRVGVSPSSLVVAYDDAGGAIAARLWWLLEACGHGRVAVLDGGLPAWCAEGFDLEETEPTVEEGDFVARFDMARAVDRLTVANRPPETLLLDARAPARFRGELEPVDPRAGHIPGAVNQPTSANLKGDRFLALEVLRARYVALGAAHRPVIAYCGSGITACHDLLALRVAGLPDGRLYEGSWSEWCSLPDAPLATGPAEEA